MAHKVFRNRLYDAGVSFTFETTRVQTDSPPRFFRAPWGPAMTDVTLHVSIAPWDDNRYVINFQLTQSDNAVDTRTEVLVDRAAFQPEAFAEHEIDPQGYGMLLGKCVFAEPKVDRLFADARAKAQQLGAPLRIRLVLNPQMAGLHDLRWETLRDPTTGEPMFVRQDVLFSRYLYSEDTRPVRVRDEGEVRALVGVAAPDDAAAFGLAPVDVKAELRRVEEALDGMEVKVLNTVGRVSLAAIVGELRADPVGYDVLYLVCHGKLVEGDPRLWLEKEARADAPPGPPAVPSAIVSGSVLADRLAALANRPRLVMLLSCESAGRVAGSVGKDGGALAAVGPRLARAGIPAVVAMQGQVSMDTVGRFVPAFFRSLRADGQIDKAMADARAAVQDDPDARAAGRDNPDAWMPVLFMRLNTGRLWARPGLQGADGAAGFPAWDALLNYIAEEKCTPIVGPEVTEDLFGSPREIARRWADLYRYPLADYHRGDLPQVAQYLADIVSPPYARIELMNHLRRELAERYGKDVPGLKPDRELGEWLADVGRWKRARDREGRADPRPDAHEVLAELRCPLYLTTNPDGLLADALREQPGVARVHERAFDRNQKKRVDDSLFAEGPDAYWPRSDQPLVYHLFGMYQKDPRTRKYDLRSLVLSQDDYFQYLTAMGQNGEAVPTPVRMALSDSALLFVGFHLHDWNFRVLLQSLEGREWTVGNTYSHVAVQVNPADGEFQDPEMARRYLQKAGKINNNNLSIYWGSTASFLRELRDRLKAREPAPVGSAP